MQILALNTGPRLGLSATPVRAGDPDGTAQLFDYFGGLVPPPFTLKDAIRSGALTPYFYHVHEVALNEAEQARWDEITIRISRLTARRDPSQVPTSLSEEQIKRLLIERARILKQACGKVAIATLALRSSYQTGDRWIVYCDDLEQLEQVLAEVRLIGISAVEYHSSMTGDKRETIKLFESVGGVIVSIRCLDEGVDIPSVSHALILASSKNPREYIQRRGRVLRTAIDKSVAHIHDIIVVPHSLIKRPSDADLVADPRLNIIGGEIIRSIEFGKLALNPAAITDLQRIALRFSNDYIDLINSGYEDDE